MNEFQETCLTAHLDQGPVQQVFNRALLLPREVILLGSLHCPVTQSLGVVPRHDPLHGGKEVLNKDLLLVVEILADTLGHRNGNEFGRMERLHDAAILELDSARLLQGIAIAQSAIL